MLCQSFSILGAEAITPADVVVQVQPVQRLESSRLFNPVKLELPRAQPMGKTVVPDRACSVGCVAATSNPAARAARASPRPTALRAGGAARREIPLAELAIIVRVVSKKLSLLRTAVHMPKEVPLRTRCCAVRVYRS